MQPASGPDAVGSSPEPYSFASLALLQAAFETGGVLQGKIVREVRTMTDGMIKCRTAGRPVDFDWVFVANVGEPIQLTGITETGSTIAAPSAAAPIKVYL